MRHCFLTNRAKALTAGAVLATAMAAQANLVLDLRLAPGNTTQVTAGQVVNLEVWGTVTGSGASAKLGTLTYTVAGGAGSGATTTLAVNPRLNPTNSALIVPALWKEDGTTKDTPATAGSSVILTVGGGFIPGDVNHDHVVDLGDVNYVTARWLNTGSDGDANGDGTIDLGDINFITARWLNTGEPGIAAALSAVPEPTTLSLLGVGAMGLLARRRK